MTQRMKEDEDLAESGLTQEVSSKECLVLEGTYPLGRAQYDLLGAGQQSPVGPAF